MSGILEEFLKNSWRILLPSASQTKFRNADSKWNREQRCSFFWYVSTLLVREADSSRIILSIIKPIWAEFLKISKPYNFSNFWRIRVTYVEQLIKKNTQLCRYLFFLYREVLIKFQSKHWWPYQWLRCYSSWSETWTGLLLSRPCLFWLPMPPSNIPISPYANNLKWINQGK